MPAQSPMHQRKIQVSCHPHARTRSPTRPCSSRDPSLCPSAEAKEKGRGAVRRTQESDRIASLAPAQIEVCAGAVLSSGGCAENQAAGAVPHYGSPADLNL